jgi:hypothetical protein
LRPSERTLFINKYVLEYEYIWSFIYNTKLQSVYRNKFSNFLVLN